MLFLNHPFLNNVFRFFFVLFLIEIGKIPAVLTHKEVGENLAKILENAELNVSIQKGRYMKPIPNINR